MFIMTSGRHVETALDPAIKRFEVSISPSSHEEPTSDRDCLKAAVEEAGGFVRDVALSCLQKLPHALRENNHQVTATTFHDLLIDVDAGKKTGRLLGAALDIGTTTVALSLHDLESGEALRTIATVNPQTQFGDDLISRLTYVAGNWKRLHEMQWAIVECVNDLIHKGCVELNVSPHDVFYITAAGNSAMNHIFLGVPPEHMATAPFTPAFRQPVIELAKVIGIDVHPGARVMVMPNIGGFVGGDVVGDLLADGILERRELSLMIDIGTNCEVVLGSKGKFLATSSPAGPALEGACIAYGMRAEPGAISDVKIEDGHIRFETIDDEAANGLCGSGLFHAIAVLKGWGVIDSRGRIGAPDSIDDPALRTFLAERLSTGLDGRLRVLLAAENEGAARDVWLEQNDVRQFQLAKGAIATGWKMLCTDLQVDPGEIQSVHIAGAFGNYIRPDAARTLGLVPSLPIERIEYIGNGALEGARLVLLQRGLESRVRDLDNEVQFVELAGREDFQETYALEMHLTQQTPTITD
jgi:uncharacterized 2Fe-2S/4Fe-4S cluster protein (DUF4445 family)